MPINLRLSYNNFIAHMEPQSIPPIQEPSQITACFSILRPQIIKSIIILEINTEDQNRFEYQLGVICPNNKIRFSTKYDQDNINRYYIFKNIEIGVDYDEETAFSLNKESDLSLIEDQSQQFGYSDSPDYLTWQSFKDHTLPKPYQGLFLQESPTLGYGFIIRIESDEKSGLSLKLSPFYGRPQGLASQYQSGLIYTQPKSGKCSFYGFCQVYKQHFRYDMMFKLPSSQTSKNVNESLIINTKMKQVNQLIQFPYDSIGFLASQEKSPVCGTASVLLNSDRKTSKFLITCAHNFIQIDQPSAGPIKIKMYNFKLAKKLTQNKSNFRQCLTSTDKLQIKTVHFHPKLLEYLDQKKKDCMHKIVYYYYEKIKNKDRQLQMHFQKMYDIAIVELNKPIQVPNGFRLRQVAKQRDYLKIDKLEVAGFPASAQVAGTTHGIMYHQAVEDHTTQKQKCFMFKRLKEIPEYQFIYHRLSTLVGNSGSPIFQKLSKQQSYLLGVHTTGIGADMVKDQAYIDDDTTIKVYGHHNRGVYIYNEEILNWIKKIQGISEVFDKKISESIWIILTNKNEHLVGVLDSNDSLLTLRRYFQDEDYPIKAFMKNQDNLYEEYQTQKVVSTADNIKLAKIKIKAESKQKSIKKSTIKISTQQQNENPIFESGYILSLDKEQKNDSFRIHQTPFSTGLPILNLFGVLFVRNKDGEICLNGFYDNDSIQKLNGTAAVVPINKSSNIQMKKRFKEAQPQKNTEKYPYTSIGILKDLKRDRYCTASILYNEDPKEPGFIITSASFFAFGQKDKYFDAKKIDCSNYIFTYGANSTSKTIKKINVPQVYYQKIKNSSQQYYDVAIIQLNQPIYEQNYGLRILKEEREREINADNIEIAGYAGTQQAGKNVKTLYYDTTRKDQEYIFFINQFTEGGDEKIKFIEHKFDTLQGQIGVPIFLNIQKDKSYLVGLHSEQYSTSEQIKPATYLYNPVIYDWIQDIIGDKRLSSSQPRLLTQVSPFGVFQILEKSQVVDYGVGILHRENTLITSQSYIREGREIGRIFFKKLSKTQDFPLFYDLKKGIHDNFIVVYPEFIKKIDKESKFISIILDRYLNNTPKFIPNKGTSLGSDNFAIILHKSNGKELVLYKVNFNRKQDDLSKIIKGEVAILFAFKVYCYGFYERQELLISKEYLDQSIPIENDIFAAKAVLDPSKNSPFDSVGILRARDRRGTQIRVTAQVLRTKKGCKYLITCASIFLSQMDKGIDLQHFQLELPQKSIDNHYGYKMESIKDFRIRKVFIPNEYIRQIQGQKGQIGLKKKVCFPAIGNIPKMIIWEKIQTFYDIAIAQLEEVIPNVQGFTIEEDIKIENPVQIAGFPQGVNRGRFFGVIQGNMYIDTTASHPNDPTCVRLSEDSDGDIVMMHKLSTLPGNSGSAIYERISDKECRLLAIHTKAVKDPKRSQKQAKLYNLATYIHSKNIKTWIKSVLDQE